MTGRGSGSLRQRSQDRWEVRVSLGPDRVSGRARVLSRTVRGDVERAESLRCEMAAQAQQERALQRQTPRTVAALLACWIDAPHTWKPSTWHGYRIAAARLSTDASGGRSLTSLSPRTLIGVVAAWRAAGVPASVVALHVRSLRAALGWALEQGPIGTQPLTGWRGLPQPEPRRDVPVPVVAALLRAGRAEVAAADSEQPLHRAQQLLLLLTLAADTGARRGELAALRTDDLDGRRLRIERGLSDEVLTTTKSGRGRTLTVGASTAQLWRELLDAWGENAAPGERGLWLFSRDLEHSRRLGRGGVGLMFRHFCQRQQHPEVTLHRLRHTVATALVSDGQLLQAQQRLGHRDASTTLRQYCHALPLNDQDAADHLEHLYGTTAAATVQADGQPEPSNRP